MVTKYGTNFYTLVRSEPANTYAALVDDDAFILVGKFDTLATPATTANVYQKGCLMAKTDAAGGVEAEEVFFEAVEGDRVAYSPEDGPACETDLERVAEVEACFLAVEPCSLGITVA